ncbi:MAG: hypothetical protein AAB036_05480, partial [Elusimicrobiota bacterium]
RRLSCVIDWPFGHFFRSNELKAALVPSSDKEEVGFLFDPKRISSALYGSAIFKQLIPLLDPRTSHSILCGDLCHDNKDQLYALLQDSLELVKPFEFDGTELHCVYLNNLTRESFKRINDGLQAFPAYIGFIPGTFSSPMRAYLSTILCRGILKHKQTVIQGHENDRPNEENCNIAGYPFEKSGYKCLSLQSMFFGLFLAYKIERPVFPGFETDTEFSLNVLSDEIVPLKELSVELEEKKLEYLRAEKGGSLKRAGISHLDPNDLAALIKSKIAASYIYNMALLPQHGTMKFNLMLELGTDEPVKITASLEYLPSKKNLRVITLY